MVAEWDAAVTKFTEWSTHRHYSTSSWTRAFHSAALNDKPCWIIVIPSTETFSQWCIPEDADSSKFRGPAIPCHIILDKAHRLRMSGTPIGKVRRTNVMLFKMDWGNYDLHMASCILSLEPQNKRISIASPLVNGIEVFQWLMWFLESSSWFTPHLLPDTFHNTLNNDDDWVEDGSTMSGTECGTGFMPVGDL